MLTRSHGLALALAALAPFATATMAQAQCGGAVAFAKGAEQTTLTASLSGLQSCDYVLAARKGQTLTATLDAPTGVEAIVIDPVEHALAPGEPLVLPQTGRYTVRVLQTRNAARQSDAARPFALTLHIGARGPAQPTKAGGDHAPAAVKPATAPAARTAAQTQCDGSGATTNGSANMSGQIAGDATCDYRLRASAGQTLTMLMDAAPGVEAWIVDPINEHLAPDQPLTLEAAGDYTIRVGRTRNDARQGGIRPFSMVVNLD